mgnify:CR=1 FL=1
MELFLWQFSRQKKKEKKKKKRRFSSLLLKRTLLSFSLSLSLGLVAKVLRRRRRKTFRISAAFFARGCSFGCVGWLLKKFYRRWSWRLFLLWWFLSLKYSSWYRFFNSKGVWVCCDEIFVNHAWCLLLLGLGLPRGGHRFRRRRSRWVVRLSRPRCGKISSWKRGTDGFGFSWRRSVRYCSWCWWSCLRF